jgi:Family of unknown function (DUF6314)
VRGVGSPGQCWQLPGSTLEFLSGRWRASRSLRDHVAGQEGSFQGVASFVPRGALPFHALRFDALPFDALPFGALSYSEQGELQFGRHRGPASRSLIFVPAPDGAAAVLFADGRPFYRLNLRSGYWQAEHPCDRDLYLVTVRVSGPDCLIEHWQASGPGKDYEMTTTLARIGAAA